MDYYQILEISQDASDEVIKAAYKALAKKYHPDAYKGSSIEREKSMTEINEAYSTLSDVNKKIFYDQKLRTDSFSKKGTETCDDSYEDKFNYEHNMNEYTCYKNAEETREKAPDNSTSSKVGRFIRNIGREIMDEMQQNVKERDNAYLGGTVMDEYILVRRFKASKGYKRIGYAQAMVEKGLLYKDESGNYRPTLLLKNYL